MIHLLLLWVRLTSTRLTFLDTLERDFVEYICLNLKFLKCRHDVPCALEKKSNAGVVESCCSTTKSIISLATQCLWSPNLTRWSHTAQSSHLISHMNLEFHGLVGSRNKLYKSYIHFQKT